MVLLRKAKGLSVYSSGCDNLVTDSESKILLVCKEIIMSI